MTRSNSKYWISSHIEIHGNSKADSAAKSALLFEIENFRIPYTDLKYFIKLSLAYILGLLWCEYYITTFKTTSLETVHRLWRGTCLRGTLCGDDTYLLSTRGAEKQKSCRFSSTCSTSVVPHSRPKGGPMRWCKPIGSQENIFVEYDSNKTVKRITQWHWNKIIYANTNAYLSFHRHGNDCRSTLNEAKIFSAFAYLFSVLLYFLFDF